MVAAPPRIIERYVLSESSVHTDGVEELIQLGLGAPIESSDSNHPSDQLTCDYRFEQGTG